MHKACRSLENCSLSLHDIFYLIHCDFLISIEDLICFSKINLYGIFSHSENADSLPDLVLALILSRVGATNVDTYPKVVRNRSGCRVRESQQYKARTVRLHS